MNITRENIDALNAVLKLSFTEEDYAENVSKTLKDYRKKANIPGFRPGMVPMGMVKKMYGKAVLADEVNKLMSQSLSNYLVEEKLPILGEPLPSTQEQTPMDFDNDTEFEFLFDVALAPEVNVELSGEDTVAYYEIDADDELIDQVVESHKGQNGKMQEVDAIEEGTENLRGDFAQLGAKGQVLKTGHKADDVLVALGVVKDEELKEKMKGAKVGDSFSIDVEKSFPNEADRAAMLQVDKEALAEMKQNFQYTITKVERFMPAEVGQELFDKVYGEGTVANEEEYRAKVAEEIKTNFGASSDFKFGQDLKAHLINKLGLELPTAFLRRWLKAANADNENLTEEVFEREYPMFEETTKWQLIKDAIYKANNMSIEQEELEAEAIKGIKAQFAQYGMPADSIPEENLKQYAGEMLQKEDERRKIWDNLFESKVVSFAKEQVSLDIKTVNREEFEKLFAPQAEAQAEEVIEALEADAAQ
jgi:trigger factor